MRRLWTLTPKVCVAAAGLVLAVSGAQATTYYNLTSLQADGTTPTGFDTVTVNNGLFTSNTNGQVVGTGVLSPFVRIQQNGNGNCKDPCIESGYNTDGSEQFETKDKGGSNWDHSLLLSDVGTELINGVLYRDFILDINESNNSADRYLSLDKFKVYMGSVGNLDNYTETPPDGAGVSDSLKSQNGSIVATKIFDIDTANSGNGDATIALNYNLNSGSGKGIDLIARVPDALFNPALGQYVYLYSSFGATGTLTQANGNNKPIVWSGDGPPPDTSPAGLLPLGNYGQSAGFEEWSTRVSKGGPLQSPEPISSALVLIGLAALGIARKQRFLPSSR